MLLLNRLNDEAAGRGKQGAALRAHLGVESISNNFLVLFHRSRAHLYLQVLSNEVKLFVLLRCCPCFNIVFMLLNCPQCQIALLPMNVLKRGEEEPEAQCLTPPPLYNHLESRLHH